MIAFEVPANTAGRILVEGEVIAQPPRGNGEPLATHAFHTGVDYAPAPLSGSGSASRSGNGRVAIGVRVEGAQRGNRIATVEAGGALGRIEVRLIRERQGERLSFRREVLINGKKVRLMDLLGHFRTGIDHQRVFQARKPFSQRF